MKKVGTLIFFCGKMGAGKSTKSKEFSLENNAVLISEDEWLSTLYPQQILSFWRESNFENKGSSWTKIIISKPFLFFKIFLFYTNLCRYINNHAYNFTCNEMATK